LTLCVAVVAIWLASSPPGISATNVTGLWDATVIVNRVEIPFRFEIAQNGNQVQGFFFEGDAKLGSTSGSFANGRLMLKYDYLNTTLEAIFEGDQLHGIYRDNRPNSWALEIRGHRFVPAPASTTDAPKVAGSWEMRRVAQEARSPSDTRTWSLFLRQSGAEVSGSILRVDGDTGYLIGRWQNGRLVLSHFAGANPLLFEAKLNSDGTLAISLDRAANYVAVRKSEARAKGVPDPPDPSRYTGVKDPSVAFRFSFPDLDGKIVSNTDARFKGKVVLLAIGGSWCPNCHDEAQYLVQLDKKYRDKGLAIVALDFEEPEQQGSLERERAFVKQYGVKYTYLIAGAPAEMWEKVPQAVNLNTWPATIFVGRDGRVKGIHSGFASPASGEFNRQLKKEFTAKIEALLAEKAASDRTASSASAAKSGPG